MPELPEVEVTRLGISRYVVGAVVTGVQVHSAKLRSLVPQDLDGLFKGQRIEALERRGKYLLFNSAAGSLLLHLGMTGHLRLLPGGRAPGKHDHLDILLDSGLMLRLNDVRRFGRVHWSGEDPYRHVLLAGIGPEPLTDAFNAGYLYRRSRGRRVPIQRFLMDSAVVAGVGNIYAAESLFVSGMLPTTPAASLALAQCERLVEAIRSVLATSIAVGHATMDFTREEEKLAYFPQQLMVYDREGEGCRMCGDSIKRGRLGNRSTYFCGTCQR